MNTREVEQYVWNAVTQTISLTAKMNFSHVPLLQEVRNVSLCVSCLLCRILSPFA